jgi:hypothetical protein
MTRATIYYVKNKPYTKDGLTRVYPECLLHPHDSKVDPDGELGIPLVVVKLSPEIANRFNATDLRHGKPINAEVILSPRQYSLGGKRVTDIYLENFSPIAEQK